MRIEKGFRGQVLASRFFTKRAGKIGWTVGILPAALVLACAAALAAAQAVPPASGGQAKPAAAPTSTGSTGTAATAVELPPSPQALLPDAFDGWLSTQPIKGITDPAQA